MSSRESLIQEQPHSERRAVLLLAELRGFLPEIVIGALLILAFLISSLISPFFLNAQFLLTEAVLYMEIGIIALGEVPIIIGGNIDISIASMLALVAGMTALVHADLGVPMELCIPFGLGLGVLLGLFNGALVAFLRVPSLAVTLATWAMYRGIVTIFLGDQSIQDFPAWFIGIDKIDLPGTLIPAPIVIFLLLALVLALVLHKTVLGRWIYAIGTNTTAARFSAVPIRRVQLAIFGLSGLMAGIAGLIMDSRLAVARYDLATGFELDAITVVVLGGTSIYGGRGTILGTVIALFLVGVIHSGMGVANIKVESQLTVIGTLLVVAVIASNVLAGARKR